MKNKDDIDILSRQTVFHGYFRVDRYQLQHRLHAGGMSATLTREVVERGHIAAVLPVDVDRDRVILIEQFRPGAMAADWEPWLLECVAGIIEPGEAAADVARRETLEETGCAVTDLVPIHRFLSTPGASSETVALFCGRTDSSNAIGIHGLRHEGEDIRPHVFGVNEAIAMLHSSATSNAITLVALQWLASSYRELKLRWSEATPAPPR